MDRKRPNSADITGLLRAWERGDSGALDQLTPLVYDELRRLARGYMRKERRDHTLQATALVNEAFLRLLDARRIGWRDRTHFFALSARIMRRVLVDAARARASLKRGGAAVHDDHSTPFDPDLVPAAGIDSSEQLCALDDALDKLARMDARQAQVIELRFFGELTVEETAETLGVSPQTVMRDWRLARAWLATVLTPYLPPTAQ
jgi:RNA polymerase sigma factor (TIGR02999 family)